MAWPRVSARSPAGRGWWRLTPHGELPVRIYVPHQAALLTLLCESDGLLGRKSNFSSFVAILEGGSGSSAPPVSEMTADHESALIELLGRKDIRTAGLVRVAHRRLARIDPRNRDVLRAVYGPMRPRGLEAWGMLAPLVPQTQAAIRAHRQCRTPKPLEYWLVLISTRLLGEIDPRGNGRIRKPPKPNDTDQSIFEAIRHEARLTVIEALKDYDAVGGGK